ncbi:MAG: phosphate acetyltransferase [Cyclonatronaceae bacterium]
MSTQDLAIISQIIEQASATPRRIGLPEAEDPRTLRAASALHTRGICTPVLFGDAARIRQVARKEEIRLPGAVEIVAPGEHDEATDFANQLYEARKHKGITPEAAKELLQHPLWFANFYLAAGYSHGTLAGAVNTTADVIRSALQSVGTREKGGMVSSSFLMGLRDGRPVTFADCAVIPYPDAAQLAGIAVDAAETHRKLTGETSRVAMLSFSTKGSARHERVSLMQEATELAQQRAPELLIDGELQFDAAFVEAIGKRKAPRSEIAGKANVFVFPNLDAGNIGYKITERVGGAVALGPILQGLAKPVNDLSRGCSADDMVLISAITALLSE